MTAKVVHKCKNTSCSVTFNPSFRSFYVIIWWSCDHQVIILFKEQFGFSQFFKKVMNDNLAFLLQISGSVLGVVPRWYAF